MTDWITGIVALLGSIGGLGGICSIFLFYRENKHAKQLENEHTANTEWQELVEKHKQREKDLEETIKTRDEIIAKKDGKIESLYKEKGELMKRNDKLSSTVAALTILRCKVVGCANRVPPMGTRDTGATEEQNANDKQE